MTTPLSRFSWPRLGALLFLVGLSLACSALGGLMAKPTPTPSPTATPQPPTATPEPSPTPTPAVALGEAWLNPDGGYRLQVPEGYEAEALGPLTTLAPPEADPNTGPLILVVVEPVDHAYSLDELHQELRTDLGPDDEIVAEDERPVDGRTGAFLHVRGEDEGNALEGVLVLAMVDDAHLLRVFGFALQEDWPEVEPVFWAVVDSLDLDAAPGEAGQGGLVMGSGEADIEALALVRDADGVYYVVGSVTNPTGNPLEGIEVHYQVTDAAGQVLAEDTIWVTPDPLPAGGTAVFSIYVGDETEVPGATGVLATVAADGPSEEPVVALEVRHSRMVRDDLLNQWVVTGEVVNPSDTQGVSLSGLGIAGLDEFGDLVTAGEDEVLIGYLPPGESAPFRASMPMPAEAAFPVQDFAVYVSGVAEAVDAWPVTFAADGYLYLDALEDLHLVGLVRNDGGQSVDLRLIAGLYDDQGTVLDAAYLDVEPPAILPDEIMPYDITYWPVMNALPGERARAKRYTVQVDYAWSWPAEGTWVDLEATDQEQELEAGSFVFRGQVHNTSAAAVDHVVVVVGLRNTTTGVVVAVADTALYDTLPPDGKAPYEVILFPEPGLNPDEVEYFVIVRGYQP